MVVKALSTFTAEPVKDGQDIIAALAQATGGFASLQGAPYRLAHDPDEVYAQGDIVLHTDGLLYSANSAIDGSVTPVPFAVGSGSEEWTIWVPLVNSASAQRTVLRAYAAGLEPAAATLSLDNSVTWDDVIADYYAVELNVAAAINGTSYKAVRSITIKADANYISNTCRTRLEFGNARLDFLFELTTTGDVNTIGNLVDTFDLEIVGVK